MIARRPYYTDGNAFPGTRCFWAAQLGDSCNTPGSLLAMMLGRHVLLVRKLRELVLVSEREKSGRIRSKGMCPRETANTSRRSHEPRNPTEDSDRRRIMAPKLLRGE